MQFAQIPRHRSGARRACRTGIAAAALALGLAACQSAVQEEIDEAAQEAASVQGDPSSPQSMMRVAELTRQGGDAATAIGLYHRAAMANPDDPRPVLRMASLMAAIGALREAEEAYGRVLVLAPETVEALRGLGNVLVALDRPREAVPRFRAALAIEEDPRTFGGLGVALDMAGDHKAAQDAYRAGLARQPSNLALRNNLGLSLALTGQFDEAIATLREIAAHPAATAQHRQNLALVYGLAGRPELAAELGRLDLDAKDVRNNLDYYTWLRARARRQISDAPSAPPNSAPPPPAPSGAPPRDLRAD